MGHFIFSNHDFINCGRMENRGLDFEVNILDTKISINNIWIYLDHDSNLSIYCFDFVVFLIVHQPVKQQIFNKYLFYYFFYGWVAISSLFFFITLEIYLREDPNKLFHLHRNRTLVFYLWNWLPYQLRSHNCTL